ncbi:hypothetical protein SGCOL_002472 [Colletotrichum sp. CLE4]
MMDSGSHASPRRLSMSSRHGVSREAAKTISARKKVKCSGEAPCTYCTKRDLECQFPEPGKKRVYSVTRIQDLQERLARYEGQGFSLGPTLSRDNDAVRVQTAQAGSPDRPPTRATAQTPTDNATQVNAASTLLGLALDQLTSPTPNNPPSGGLGNHVASSPSSAIAADSSLSSSHTFGSRLQNLLEHPRPGRREPMQPPARSFSQTTTLKPSDDGGTSAGGITLPSEDEARRLFESMTFFIGYTQHHIDTREFSDRLAFFYANLGDNSQAISQAQMPWYLEMLLVFAIGKLFSGGFDGEEKGGGLPVPGASMFAHVQARLPSLSELYGLGKLGIEIHALAAVYLQNANRKEEAYLYISSALRLATTHGYHRKSGTQHLLQSEKVHLNRLWWTVYMQERRLAAATGNPAGILDDVIEIDMPTDSPGFPPALPLRTNIKIARVTGRILSTIYGPGNHPEETFVPNVQEIVQSLYWIAKEIPGEFSPKLSDMPSMEGDVSLRTSAYLHMMLYQAILLTIRPVMLHVSKLIFDEESGDTTFGFFDLDAIFSAAFIMILTMTIDSTCDESQKLAPSPGLSEALEILDHLVGRGNEFALQRAREVRRMRDHLSTFLDIPKNSPSEFRSHPAAATRSEAAVEKRSPATMVVSTSLEDKGAGEDARARQQSFRDMSMMRGSVERGGLTPSGSSRASQLGSRSLLDSSLWNDISYLWMQPAGADDAQAFDQAEGMTDLLPEDAFNWNSIYHNQGLALTGQDLGDFGELERHILGFGG